MGTAAVFLFPLSAFSLNDWLQSCVIMSGPSLRCIKYYVQDDEQADSTSDETQFCFSSHPLSPSLINVNDRWRVNRQQSNSTLWTTVILISTNPNYTWIHSLSIVIIAWLSFFVLEKLINYNSWCNYKFRIFFIKRTVKERQKIYIYWRIRDLTILFFL